MEVIGHRGAAALAPENTFASFDVALRLGVDAIETDVQSTSDGHLVLIHDDRLERTTNGEGLVCETPWAVLRELDAGGWFGPQYRGERIPELRPFLERYAQQIPIALEIKQAGVEMQSLETVQELGVLSRITFTSFHFDAVRLIKLRAPEARVGFLSHDVHADTVMRVMSARMEQFCPPARLLTPELVQAWKDLGLVVRAWGVKDPSLMQHAIDCGVDGMTVDFSHLLLKALGRPVPDWTA